MRHLLIISLLLSICTTAFAGPERKYYERGMEYLQKGEVDKAVRHLQKALDLSPPPIKPQILNMIGIAYLQKPTGIGDAIRSFEEAIKLNPGYTEPYINLATLYGSLRKEPEMAEQLFLKAIGLDPRAPKAYLGLGWHYLMEQQNAERANEMFAKAVEINPELPRAQFGLGLSYAALGKPELALKPISVLRSLKQEELAQRIEFEINKKAPEVVTVGMPAGEVIAGG